VLSGYLRDARPYFFELWIAAPPAPVGLAEERRVPEQARLAFHRPNHRFITASEWFFPFHISRPLQLILNTVK
jgi:hypothetical protein